MSRWGKTGPAILAVILSTILSSAVHAQRKESSPVRVGGLDPNGGRSSVTENWGSLGIDLTNPEPIPRAIRIAIFYADQPNVQFERDIWVPAESRVHTWLTIGPAPNQSSAHGRKLNYLLYDLRGGEPHLLSPGGDDRLRTKLVVYRKREPTTAVLLDGPPTDVYTADPKATRDSDYNEAVHFARSFRLARSLSEMVTEYREAFIPANALALDGVDHFVLASNRIAGDPAGQRALRHWLQQGGKLWVLLDLVEPRAIASILGEDLGFEVVGRTSLTSIQILQPWESAGVGVPREFERPVSFVRVALDGSENVLFQVDGWPAAFTKPVGRGKILFTTLGGRAWYRPREPRDEKSPFPSFPFAPIPLGPMDRLGLELQPERDRGGIQNEDLAPILRSEIGYSVIGRPTVMLVLGGFAVSLVAIAWLVRQSRRPAMAGWLAPMSAVVAAAILVTLGQARRQAVPPTAGTVAIIDAVPPNGEAVIGGLFGMYRPTAGPAHLASQHGGNVDFDATGLEGQIRKRVVTDIDSWNWEGLALPAGVRTGPFRATIDTGELAAVARFGPDGLQGRFNRGPFASLTEPVLLTPAHDAVGLQLRDDGSFASGIADALPPGQYLSNTVLTDRQQRRLEVYRRLFTRPIPRHLDGRTVLLAWTDLNTATFVTEPGDKAIGEALVAIPIEFDRPAAGTRITIPAGFIPSFAIVQGHYVRPTTESNRAANMQLGFRLPRSVLPLTIERATVRVRVRAPSRKFSIVAYADNQPVTVQTVESPIDPIVVELKDPRHLQVDSQGYLHLGIDVSGRTGGDAAAGIVQLDETWRIESLTLEIVGRTEARK